MSKEEYEALKNHADGKIPLNPDPNAYGGITQSYGYVTDPRKPYFNNWNGYVVVQFNAPGAHQAFQDANLTEKPEANGATSFGLGEQGSKPPTTGKKKPKKGKNQPAPSSDPSPALGIFNDHLVGWQVVDAKIDTPAGWQPPAASCN